MRVVVFGAHRPEGRRACGEIVRASLADELVVADRDHERAQRMAELLGGREGSVTAQHVEPADPEALAAAVSGADLVVNCLRTEEVGIAAAVAESGGRFVSCTEDPRALAAVDALEPTARARGASLVPGCGLTPGLSHALALRACAPLEEVAELEIHVARSCTGSTAQEGLANTAAALAFAGGADRNPRACYFPEPVGWVETWPAGLAGETPLRATTGARVVLAFAGTTEAPAADVVRAGLRLGGTRLAQPLAAILGALPARAAGWSAVRVDARGVTSGHHRVETLGVVDQLVNLMALPLAFAAVRVARAELVPGVHYLHTLTGPGELLGALRRRGLSVARLQSEPL